MNPYQYRVTLQTGQIAIANSGIHLDLLIKDRWEQVVSIEVVPYGTDYTWDGEEEIDGDVSDENQST